LFLRNLPFHFRDEHLRQLIVSLVDEGENAVELCRVKYSLNQGKTLQVGIVMLRTEEAAKQVLERISASPRCCGRDISAVLFDVEAESKQSHDGAVQFSFDVDFMEPQVTEQLVREMFEAMYGGIITICIRSHYFKQVRQYGYGFVSFGRAGVDEELQRGGVRRWNGVTYQFRVVKGDNQHSMNGSHFVSLRTNQSSRINEVSSLKTNQSSRINEVSLPSAKESDNVSSSVGANHIMLAAQPGYQNMFHAEMHHAYNTDNAIPYDNRQLPSMFWNVANAERSLMDSRSGHIVSPARETDGASNAGNYQLSTAVDMRRLDTEEYKLYNTSTRASEVSSLSLSHMSSYEFCESRQYDPQNMCSSSAIVGPYFPNQFLFVPQMTSSQPPSSVNSHGLNMVHHLPHHFSHDGNNMIPVPHGYVVREQMNFSRTSHPAVQYPDQSTSTFYPSAISSIPK
jgi:hypothetical protein